MKVTSKIQKADFEPVEVTLTLTSQDEVESLYAIFNHGYITDAVGLNAETTAKIRRAIANNRPVRYETKHHAITEKFRYYVKERGC